MLSLPYTYKETDQWLLGLCEPRSAYYFGGSSYSNYKGFHIIIFNIKYLKVKLIILELKDHKMSISGNAIPILPLL